MRVPFRSYVTLNFDPILANQSRFHERKVFSYRSLPAEEIAYRSAFYIHGLIEEDGKADPEKNVLGERVFAKAYNHVASVLPGFLQQLLTYRSVLFIGCSLREPALQPLFKFCYNFQKDLEPMAMRPPPKKYILLPVLLA
jgi:hypothetical protein